jgi:hypothetical protein
MPMPRVQRINAGKLIAHLDRSLDTRRDLTERIVKHLPGLIERARVTNRLVVQLLKAARSGSGSV